MQLVRKGAGGFLPLARLYPPGSRAAVIVVVLNRGAVTEVLRLRANDGHTGSNF
jgi:hypothetical protein